MSFNEDEQKLFTAFVRNYRSILTF